VATGVGGLKDLLEHERTGLIESENESALAAAVCRLIEEPGLAGRLSLAGLSVAESCAAPAILTQWAEAFSRVLAIKN
jgi:glycosyltransferase involved in cell wall biosynthesis